MVKARKFISLSFFSCGNQPFPYLVSVFWVSWFMPVSVRVTFRVHVPVFSLVSYIIRTICFTLSTARDISTKWKVCKHKSRPTTTTKKTGAQWTRSVCRNFGIPDKTTIYFEQFNKRTKKSITNTNISTSTSSQQSVKRK